MATPHARLDAEALVKRLEFVESTRRRRWGRMTAHQMVCHLTDSFRMATGSLTVRDRSPRVGRGIVKWIALTVPLAWPSGIPTSRELDQEGDGTRPGEFIADRRLAIDALRAFAALPAPASSPPHPIFGPMTHGDWLRWAQRHTDHHLRQFGV